MVGKDGEVARDTLFWGQIIGIGANIDGKAQVMQLYLGGFSAYKEYTKELAD